MNISEFRQKYVTRKYIMPTITILALAGGFWFGTHWMAEKNATPEPPKDINLSVGEINKKIDDFVNQARNLQSQIQFNERWLANTPEQDKLWLDSAKTATRKWVGDAKEQLGQITVVINTLTAVKTDSTIRSK